MLEADSCLLLGPPFDCCIPFLTNLSASLRFLKILKRESLFALKALSASSLDSYTKDSGSFEKIKLRRNFSNFPVFNF